METEPTSPVLPQMRLFVALPVPLGVQEVLSECCGDCPHAGLRWKEPEHYHFTLKFLGAVERNRVEQICSALDGVRVSRFPIEVGEVGSFSKRGSPFVLWAGPIKIHPFFLLLRRRVEEALLRCGFELETRPFRPHVTLAKVGERGAESARQFVKKNREFEPVAMVTERMCLYESRAGRYIEQATWSLPDPWVS